MKIKNYKLKIVANIPYYITGKFLRLFLSDSHLGVPPPSTMVLMVQREVAERICAKDGKESLLSVSVKIFGKPTIVRYVSRGSFSPPPNVDSAILKITDIKNPFRTKKSETHLFNVVRKAFQQRRKMLKKSLRGLSIPKEFEKKRPEDLSVENWTNLITYTQRQKRSN